MSNDLLMGITTGHEYITTGGQIIIALIVTMGAVIGPLLLSTRNQAKKATDAGHGAKRAAETAGRLSEPTSNGFAAGVTHALERIEQAQRQQGRDLGGIRAEMRTEREERIALAAQFRDHIKESRAS